MTIIGRRKIILWIAFSILFLSLAGFSLWAIKLHRWDQPILSEYLIGNRASHVKVLEKEELPFSFLVIGDIHNSLIGKALIKKALKDGKSFFMVILGDFVSKPDIWQHRYFQAEMAKEIKPNFPVFLVPGNHDIDYASSKGGIEGQVTPEMYESLYGARDFHFTYNGCLFILCGIDPEEQGSYLSYLRDVLSKEGGGKRHIFVFIHHPPNGVGTAGSFYLPYEKEFFSLLEIYEVTSCFFGDYHAYWRGQRRGTNLIVSGGGGGRLKKWQPEWGKFHHLLRITVNEDMINEEMMILKGVVSPVSELRRWVCIHLFPTLRDRDWVLYCGMILFLSLGTLSIVYFVVSLERKE
jgi:hypothetical protein